MKIFIQIIFLLLIPFYLVGQEKKQAVENILLPPVSTFADACARCHGDEGNNYGDEFAKIEREELHKITEDMMYGPAFLQPNEVDIEAMTSYQAAISKDEPFAIVVNAASYLDGEDELLKIETSLNSDIVESEDYEVEKGEKDFQYLLKPKDKQEFKITVERNGKTSSFIFPGTILSHGAD